MTLVTNQGGCRSENENPPVVCLGRARVNDRRVPFLLTHPVVFRSYSTL